MKLLLIKLWKKLKSLVVKRPKTIKKDLTNELITKVDILTKKTTSVKNILDFEEIINNYLAFEPDDCFCNNCSIYCGSSNNTNRIYCSNCNSITNYTRWDHMGPAQKRVVCIVFVRKVKEETSRT